MKEPRVALVTGAGSGIGRATAVLLSSRGFAVSLVGRRTDALAATAASLEKGALHAEIAADVGHSSAAIAMIDQR